MIKAYQIVQIEKASDKRVSVLPVYFKTLEGAANRMKWEYYMMGEVEKMYFKLKIEEVSI